jgi:hypothetical protein
MDIRISGTEKENEADPFLRLGYGMNAYFGLMVKLIYLMLFVSLFALPFVYHY